MQGLELPGFTDLAPLGSGGLGDVYRATRSSTGATVAIKILRDWSDREAARRRAERELRALVDLRGHPNVINVEEVIDTGTVLAIVMEDAPGGSLVDLVQARGGTLTFPETLLVATDAASALAAAHDRGIVHRDIKPANLLIGAFGSVKVCDFGIAALTRSAELSDRTNSLSLRYASPEDLRGDPAVGPATDIYSLAATVHHLLVGSHLPSPDGTAKTIPLRHWTAPEQLPSDVEVEFRSLIVQSADREPDHRPSASALHDALERLAGRLGAQRCRALPVLATRGGDQAATSAVADRSDEATPATAPVVPSATATGAALTEPVIPAATATGAALTEPVIPAATATGASVTAPLATPLHDAPSTPPHAPPARRRGRTAAMITGFAAVAIGAVALIGFTLGGDSSTSPSATTSPVAVPPIDGSSPTSVAAPSVPTTAPVDTTVPATSSPSTTTPTPSTSVAPLVIASATESARFEVPAADRFGGRSFESVDGLAFDPLSGRLVAAREVARSDVAAADPSRALPALFSVSVDDPSDITPLGTLSDEQGAPFGSELDIEGITALGDGTFVIVSEGSGELDNEGGSFLLRVDGAGAFVSRFGFPEWLTPSEDGTTGFADRLGPHGVAVRPGTTDEVVVIMEAALRQDDPNVIRLTSFDVNTGQATGEWSYPIDTSVIVSMTTIADRGLLVLEQTLPEAIRRLYLVELDDPDVPGGPAPAPLGKVRVDTDDSTFGATPWASISDVTTADGRLGAVLMTDSRFVDAASIGTQLVLD